MIETNYGFQSTLPMRGATNKIIDVRNVCKISIHAPHAGSDVGREFIDEEKGISIHAPHAGSDSVIV